MPPSSPIPSVESLPSSPPSIAGSCSATAPSSSAIGTHFHRTIEDLFGRRHLRGKRAARVSRWNMRHHVKLLYRVRRVLNQFLLSLLHARIDGRRSAMLQGHGLLLLLRLRLVYHLFM